MSLPQITCKVQNHFQMPLQYICLHPHCLRNSQQLACIYCCQQLHKSHLQDIKALKIVLNTFQKSIKTTEFGTAEILLNGIYKCRTQRELKQNVGELLSYSFGEDKFEKIIDRNNQIQRNQTKQFYLQRNNNNQLDKTIKKPNKQPLQISTNFITPILTFSAEDAIEQGYQLKSPFCVVNLTQKLVTAFAYPPLNRFEDSIQIAIKVQRITPFWLGIGVSIGKKKYQPDSKDHIMMTSNGWVSILGKQTKTTVKYCLKDTVKVKLDKKMQLIQFIANSERQSIPIQLKWNQDIFLCCSLYYKNDSIQILA